MQPERTALAWRRTALTIIIGSLLAARVLWVELDPLALAPAGLALVLGIGVLIGGEVRYRQHHRALIGSSSDHVPLSGGGMIVILASAVVVLGVLALVVVLASSLT